jgi:8-oxo-dGTP diphosphatase
MNTLHPIQAISFLRSCVNGGERLNAEDNAMLDAAIAELKEPIVRVGVAVLISRDGKWLMHKRKGSHGAGTWSFPGGHIDFGDTPVFACRREVLEETGLEVGYCEPYRYLPYANADFIEGKQYITLFFVAEYIGGEPKVMEPDKCDGDWIWVDPVDPPKPLFGALSGHWDDLVNSTGPFGHE